MIKPKTYKKTLCSLIFSKKVFIHNARTSDIQRWFEQLKAFIVLCRNTIRISFDPVFSIQARYKDRFYATTKPPCSEVKSLDVHEKKLKK